METKEYQRIFVRVKAAMLDAIVMILLMVGATYLFSFFDSVPSILRGIAFLFIFGLYDPIFTSSFGGTIGHMFVGIQVKRENDESKNISFPLAIIRFLFKYLLGFISFFTIMSDKKGKAIHDMIVRSVVLFYEGSNNNENLTT